MTIRKFSQFGREKSQSYNQINLIVFIIEFFHFTGIEEANEKIQKNMTKLEDYIENTFSLSPSVIQSLINATFSKDLVSLYFIYWPIRSVWGGRRGGGMVGCGCGFSLKKVPEICK